MRVMDCDALERLEDEVEQLRRAVRESADIADRTAATSWPSSRLAAALALGLFAFLAFTVGRMSGEAMAHTTSCKLLPRGTEAQMTLRTPDRTITFGTDGEIAITSGDPTCTTVRRRKVAPEAVRALVDRLSTSCFFEMHPSYTSPGDGLVNELTVRAGAKANTVRHPVRSWGEFPGGCALPRTLLGIEADAIVLATRD